VGLEGDPGKNSAEIAKDSVLCHAARGMVQVRTEDNQETVGKKSYAEQEEDQANRDLYSDPQPVDRHDGEDDSPDGGVVFVSFNLREYAIDSRAIAECKIRSFANTVFAGLGAPVVQARRLAASRRFSRDSHMDSASLERRQLSVALAGLQAQGDGDFRAYSGLDIVSQLLHAADYPELFVQVLSALPGDGGFYTPVAVLITEPYSHAGGSGRIGLDFDLVEAFSRLFFPIQDERW